MQANYLWLPAPHSSIPSLGDSGESRQFIFLLKIYISHFLNRVFGRVGRGGGKPPKTITKGIDCMAELLCLQVFIVCHWDLIVCISLLASLLYQSYKVT